jgi:hypothetical protein
LLDDIWVDSCEVLWNPFLNVVFGAEIAVEIMGVPSQGVVVRGAMLGCSEMPSDRCACRIGIEGAAAEKRRNC